MDGRSLDAAQFAQHLSRPLSIGRLNVKKILILGVNGFIGHHLSKRILETTDWEVHGMDMLSDKVSDLMENPRFNFFEGDITINKEWVEYHVRSATWCYRWWPSPPRHLRKDPLRVFELDFEATPIVRQCVKYKKRVLFRPPPRCTACAATRDRPLHFGADPRPDQ